ncbi:MAG: glycosyltransferase family 4 protein [Candidatus Stygibacter australis]|nr:glycosyltransferase family 4 protein [Candidatus Stygibacter australis]
MRILHLLAQRPGLTGSGVYLQSIVRLADAEGHQQAVICGIPAGEVISFDAKYQPEQYAVFFETTELPFPVTGMSNVMPYKSTRYNQLKGKMLQQWKTAFTQQITKAIEEFQPDIILSHHLWLLSALALQITSDIPIYLINHGTALRQTKFCPHLAAEIVPHLQRADLVYALNETQRDKLIKEFQLDPEKIKITGNGYNEAVFYFEKRQPNKIKKLVYAGKIAYAKGIRELLFSLNSISASEVKFELTLCGSGAGNELQEIKSLAEKCTFPITFTGNLTQPELADIFRASDIFILPSYYEGLPLVLIEALACGLQVIVNDLAGLKEWLEKAISNSKMIDFVTPPELNDVYEPLPAEIPAYCLRLKEAIHHSLKLKSQEYDLCNDIRNFSWIEVYNRIKQYW